MGNSVLSPNFYFIINFTFFFYKSINGKEPFSNLKRKHRTKSRVHKHS